MQRLEIQLIGGLHGHELHCRALDGLGDGLRIAKVVLLSLRVRAHLFRRNQPGIMAKPSQPAAEMMGTNTGLHANQAGRHVDYVGDTMESLIRMNDDRNHMKRRP